MAVTKPPALHYTCFLVEDIEKSAEQLTESLSISWNLWTLEPKVCSVQGQPSRFSFRVAMTQAGDESLELVSPQSGESIYAEHLKTRGDGFHHTCLAYPDLGSLKSAKAELLAKGHRMIQHAYTDGSFEFDYFELPEEDSTLELLYLKELPPPEKTIGEHRRCDTKAP